MNDMTGEKADLAMLRELLATKFAPYVGELELELLDAIGGEVALALPVAPKHVHGGGVLCGQSMMAAADTAMILAVCSRLGEFRPVTTVQLQTSFLRAVPGDAGRVRIDARVLRMGSRLAFGEVRIADARGELAAHATASCLLL